MILREEQRPGSTLVWARHNGHNVVIKKYRVTDTGPDAETLRKRVEREARLLTLLSQAKGRPRRLGVVQLLAVRPEDYTIELAVVPGQPVETLFFSSLRAARPTLLRVAWLAGRWLRWFQQAVPVDGNKASEDCDTASNLPEYCRIRLERLCKFRNSQANQTLCAAALRRLNELLAKVDLANRKVVVVHADYAPFNIIWDGYSLTPVDFGMAKVGDPWIDVTYFMHRLLIGPAYRPWQRIPVGAATKAFLRGYGEPQATQCPLFQAFLIRHTINRLTHYTLAVPRNIGERVQFLWLRYFLRRQLWSLLLSQ